jgi:hypothetical protein
MSKKKDDKPYMPFYIGDWLKAPEVRALPLNHRMVWFEILCIMWQGDEKGYLTINNAPFVITDDITGVITEGDQLLSSMLGISSVLLQETFQFLKKLGVYKKREDGAIYSGFMVKLVQKQQVKSKAGKKGMKKRYENSVMTPVITPFEYDINKEVDSIIVQLRELVNVEISENEKNFFSMIVLKMVDAFLKQNPDYFFQKETDYAACLQIAYHIAHMKKWSKHDVINGKMNDCINSWKTIVEFIKDDKWFNTRSLSDLSTVKEWQRLVQTMNKKIKNETTQRNSGKSGTKSSGANELLDSLKGDLGIN